MLSTASSAFTKIKMPIVNQLRVTGRMDEIAELWIQRTRISLACYLLGSLALILAGNVGLRIVGSKTMLLPSGELVLMLLIVGLELIMDFTATSLSQKIKIRSSSQPYPQVREQFF